jgi:hypothetical protein
MISDRSRGVHSLSGFGRRGLCDDRARCKLWVSSSQPWKWRDIPRRALGHVVFVNVLPFRYD